MSPVRVPPEQLFFLGLFRFVALPFFESLKITCRYPCPSLSPSFPHFLPPSVPPSLPPLPLTTVRQKGESVTGYYRFLTKYGHYVWLQTKGAMVVDQRTGKPSHVVCIHFVIRYVSYNIRYIHIIQHQVYIIQHQVHIIQHQVHIQRQVHIIQHQLHIIQHQLHIIQHQVHIIQH